MPGTILVSVLGLMDLPSCLPLSCLTLKVAIGKTEYQAVGGQLSFPVVSLRENLIIVILDAEGKEILRTEFRTLLLLEQGHWDNFFPLKNGGSVHMKLQFLLGDGDRKRIREVRDAALKKRLVQNASTKILRPFFDNKIEDSITRTVAEVKGMVLDRSDPTDPGECGSAPGNLLPHVSEQFSENLVQHDSHDLTIRRDKRQLDCSQSSVHGNSAENNSCMSNDQEEHKYFHPKSKDMQSKDLNNNIKKIISTFESNTYQDVRSFDQRANLRRTNLVTGVSPNSAVADGSHLKFPQALSKSFSAGMLLEMGSKESKKHVDSHFVQKNKETQNSVSTTSSDALESKKQLEILKNDKMIEKVDSCTKDTLPDIPYSVASIRSIATENVPKMNDNSKESKKHVDSHFVKKNKEAQNSVITTSSDTFEMKNDKVIQKVDSCTKDTLPDTPNSAASNRSMATEDVLKMSDTKEFTGLNTSIAAGSERKRFEFVLDERSSSTMPTLKNYEAVEGKLNFNPMFKGGGNQDTDATFEAFQEMPSSSSGKLESICEHNGKGKRQQKEIFDESKRIEDPNNMPIHQKETSIMIARKVCDETVLSGLSMDIVPASSYGKASAWIFGYSSLCPVGILGLWIPRHLCITTGSKILKDFVDSCAVTSVATSIESSLIIEANTQQNKHSDICIKTKEVKLLRSPRNSYMENFLDSLKSTRGMIEQGGWIVVVIVACGLLLIGG